jgi:RNA polymerase sigma-70 factor (ECF subfamily)
MHFGGEITIGRRSGGDHSTRAFADESRGVPLEEVAAADESRWLQQAREGDAEAFERLVNLHGSKVASVVARLLGDPNDAADAVQETFLRAFQGLRRFRGEASVRTWLIQIAVNVCKSQRAAFWRRRVTLGEDALAQAADPVDLPELAAAAVLQRDRQAALRRALQELPETLRLPILLHFYEDLTGAEIARVLGWNESTVWSRIYAGCRKLRKRLGPEWER